MFGRLPSALKASAPTLFRRCEYKFTQVAFFAMPGKKVQHKRQQTASNNKYKDANTGNSNYSSIPTDLVNENIRFSRMRVVYTNPKTGEGEWQILSREDALNLAREMKLDLVLGKTLCSLSFFCIILQSTEN
jgi:hypothetical protein